MLMHAAMMPRTMPILRGERTTVVFKLPTNVGGGAVEFNADSVAVGVAQKPAVILNGVSPWAKVGGETE